MSRGEYGEAIHDLQRRLSAAGFPSTEPEPGIFGEPTASAVAAFQSDRGLAPSGHCDERTWLALVEATWKLGDRSLRHVVPHPRGDDVEALQNLLTRVGFDCGKVDGIFGPKTSAALEMFQRHSGLRVDGVCGPETVRALQICATHSGSGPGVAALRELANLGTQGDSLNGRRIVVGEFGGLSRFARRTAHVLGQHGANAIHLHELDPSAQALAANRHDAAVYLGFRASAEATVEVAYYRTPNVESLAGHFLAERLVHRFEQTRFPSGRAVGLRHPVLRETRMPAVLCTLGPIPAVNDAVHDLVDQVQAGVSAWVFASGDMTPAGPPLPR